MTKKEFKEKTDQREQNIPDSEQQDVGSVGKGADSEIVEDDSENDGQFDFNEEIKKEKDNFLRLFAEFENYKKRTSRERIELFSTANRELMTALLPVLDDFERGLSEIEKASDGPLLEGMKLIYNKFKNTLTQKGLKEVEVKAGDSFDAEVHEAISQVPAPDKKLKGKIIDVVEKGYKLGDSIIRYPKVVMGS
jgi:molecular chaperone GrpE